MVIIWLHKPWLCHDKVFVNLPCIVRGGGTATQNVSGGEL